MEMSKVLNDQSAKNNQFTIGIIIARISFIVLFFRATIRLRKQSRLLKILLNQCMPQQL